MNAASSEPKANVQAPPSWSAPVSRADKAQRLSNKTRRAGRGSAAKNALLRFFWMRVRLELALHRQYSPGQPGWSEFSFARIALADADQIRETGASRPSALVLYRAAAHLMMQAQMARAGTQLETDRSANACWKRFGELPVGTCLLATLRKEQRGHVAACFDLEGESHWTNLHNRQRRQAVAAMAKFAHAAAVPLEKDARATRSVFIQRWLRIGAPALLLLIVAFVVVGRAIPRTNLALHKPVTAVVLDPNFTPDPGALVDGNRTNLGVYASEIPTPQVTIDLGSLQRVSRVVIYNRSDCCKDRAIPLGVEVSQTPGAYHLVAIRTQPFERWRLDFPLSDVRYIHLTLWKPGILHLAEVEVY